MSHPLIGITSSLTADGQQILDRRYIEAVERAGGAPLVLPMTSGRAALEPVLERIDGLLITGGPGIERGLIGVLPESTDGARVELRGKPGPWISKFALGTLVLAAVRLRPRSRIVPIFPTLALVRARDGRVD